MPIAKQQITPCLWFDKNAEEAANFYITVFKNSKITRVVRFGNAGQEVHGGTPGAVLAIDFEQFLDSMEETLASVLSHYGLDASSERISALMQSPLLTRYSKAPEQPYSREMRAQVLDQSRKNYADEIAQALNWLDTLAQRHASVAALLK